MIPCVAEPVILCLETSTPRASVALLRGAEVLFEAAFTSDRSHNSGLFAPLQEALASLLDGEPLACVVVGTGPGSYSGTRVGIAAAQGVAMVHGCPAVGLSSLAAVPLAAFPALAVGDARRGTFWWAWVKPGKAVPEPDLGSVEELERVLVPQLDYHLPAFSLESLEKSGLDAALRNRVELLMPDATLLGRAWQALNPAEQEILAVLPPQPVYLRPPHITEAKGGHPLVTAGRRSEPNPSLP